MTVLGNTMVKTAASIAKLSPKVNARFMPLSRLKEAAISDEQAQGALNRLDTLERNKPTLRQAGRYGALGAAAGPIVGAVGNVIAGKPLKSGVTLARTFAGDAAKGAIAGGAVPLLRSHLDRGAEVKTLRNYLAERQKEAAFVDTIKRVGGEAAAKIHHLEDPIEVGGLVALAAPNIDNMIAKRRAAKAGDTNVDRYRLIKSRYHDPIEAGGLGVLAAPIVGKMIAEKLKR